MTSEEKRRFLKGLIAGTASLWQLLPFSVLHLVKDGDVVTDQETGRVVGPVELEYLQDKAERQNQFIIVHVLSHVPIATCEEDVDMTPWTPSDSLLYSYSSQKQIEL